MIYAKPTTSKIHERSQDLLYFFEHTNNNYSKKQLCELLGWEYNSSNDRRIRDVISYLAQSYPIIAVSDNSGYRLAKGIADSKDVLHQLRELQSRIDELKKRMHPLHKMQRKLKINSVTT